MTDACKNINLPQTSFPGGTNALVAVFRRIIQLPIVNFFASKPHGQAKTFGHNEQLPLCSIVLSWTCGFQLSLASTTLLNPEHEALAIQSKASILDVM